MDIWARLGLRRGDAAIVEASPVDTLDVDRAARTLTDGSPVTDDHREIDPSTGLQKAYVVLSAEERGKGFLRPIRRSYRHVGARPANPVRPLTEAEQARYAEFGYVVFEAYPDGGSVSGKFWTQAQLSAGCGEVTTMGQALAETYARDPSFYGATFCAVCRAHFPVGAGGEFVWEGTTEKVGT